MKSRTVVSGRECLAFRDEIRMSQCALVGIPARRVSPEDRTILYHGYMSSARSYECQQWWSLSTNGPHRGAVIIPPYKAKLGDTGLGRDDSR